MNKKGFTIIELLAVIVILGILSSIAMIGISKYRETVKKKELISLHSTIDSWYDSYRSDLVIKGQTASSSLSLKEAINAGLDIAYSGEKITVAEGKIELKIKGDLLNKTSYTTDKTEENYIKDGTCYIKAKKNGASFDKNCVISEGKYVPSKEELLCIYLEKDGETLIDDFNDDNNLCHYWSDNNA